MKHHLPALVANPDSEVTAVADLRVAKAEAAAAEFEVAHVFGSAEALCASGAVDAVVVAVPHAAHYACARAAIDNGLHVLVEKPMTLQPADAADLVARARGRGLHLVVGHTYNFAEHVAAARSIVASGFLGPLRLVSVLYTSARRHLYGGREAVGERPGPDDPEPTTYTDPAVAGGGQGQTELTHAVACVLYVSGRRVTQVAARFRSLDYPVDVVDTLLAELDGPGRTLVTMASTGVIPPGLPEQREVRYYGDDGVLLHDLTTGAVRAMHADGRCIEVAPAAAADVYPTGAPSACLVRLTLEGGDGENPAPGELGAAVVACTSAAYESDAAGGSFVAVT